MIIVMSNTKRANFKRLAEARGNKVLKDLRLVGNLSNKNNYEYTDKEVSILFSAIEQELRVVKASFQRNKKNEVKL